MGSIYNVNYSEQQYANNHYAPYHSYCLPQPEAPNHIYCHNPYWYEGAIAPPPLDSQGAFCQCEDCCGRAYYAHQQFQQSVLPAPVYTPTYTPEASEGMSEHSEATEAPTEELTAMETKETSQLDPMERSMKFIFIGQLPFEISDNKVNWLVRTIGRASKVYQIDAVWKQSRTTGEMQHKGCAHVLVPRSEVDFIVQNLHHRLLISQEQILVGTPAAVNHWAGRAFDADIRTASKPVVCEPSSRQLRK